MKTNAQTQTVFTAVVILPHHAGFGMWQRGELSVGPTTSYAVLSDLERAGDLTPLGEALQDPEFRAAGIEDIRGRIYNQPGRLYARLEKSIDGVSVAYHGVVESEVSEDFFKAAS